MKHRSKKEAGRALRKADGCAVDMLLEQHVAGSAGGWEHCFEHAAEPAFRRRLERAERLFKVLDLMPVGDPPANLVADTLRRVAQADARHAIPGAMVFGSTPAARPASQQSLH